MDQQQQQQSNFHFEHFLFGPNFRQKLFMRNENAPIWKKALFIFQLSLLPKLQTKLFNIEMRMHRRGLKVQKMGAAVVRAGN